MVTLTFLFSNILKSFSFVNFVQVLRVIFLSSVPKFFTKFNFSLHSNTTFQHEYKVFFQHVFTNKFG